MVSKDFRIDVYYTFKVSYLITDCESEEEALTIIERDCNFLGGKPITSNDEQVRDWSAYVYPDVEVDYLEELEMEDTLDLRKSLY